jgi:hypothetical protein
LDSVSILGKIQSFSPTPFSSCTFNDLEMFLGVCLDSSWFASSPSLPESSIVLNVSEAFNQGDLCSGVLGFGSGSEVGFKEVEISAGSFGVGLEGEGSPVGDGYHVGEVDLTNTEEDFGLLKAPGLSVYKDSSFLFSDLELVMEKGLSCSEFLGLPFVVGLEGVGSPMGEVVLTKLEEDYGLLKHHDFLSVRFLRVFPQSQNFWWRKDFHARGFWVFHLSLVWRIPFCRMRYQEVLGKGVFQR